MRAKKLLTSRQIFQYAVPARTVTRKHCPQYTTAYDTWSIACHTLLSRRTDRRPFYCSLMFMHQYSYTLCIGDIALVLQQNRLRWYGHVLRKDDDDWVKKCMEYEVQHPRPRGRPKRTWREVVREDCQAHKMNKEDAIDRCKWRKMIKDVR